MTTCEYCGHYGECLKEITFTEDGQAVCRKGCLQMAEVLQESFWVEIDLTDPVVAVY
jgi:hypothetical protein